MARGATARFAARSGSVPRTATRPRLLETAALGLGAASILAGLACLAMSFEAQRPWSRVDANGRAGVYGVVRAIDGSTGPVARWQRVVGRAGVVCASVVSKPYVLGERSVSASLPLTPFWMSWQVPPPPPSCPAPDATRGETLEEVVVMPGDRGWAHGCLEGEELVPCATPASSGGRLLSEQPARYFVHPRLAGWVQLLVALGVVPVLVGLWMRMRRTAPPLRVLLGRLLPGRRGARRGRTSLTGVLRVERAVDTPLGQKAVIASVVVGSSRTFRSVPCDLVTPSGEVIPLALTTFEASQAPAQAGVADGPALAAWSDLQGPREVDEARIPVGKPLVLDGDVVPVREGTGPRETGERLTLVGTEERPAIVHVGRPVRWLLAHALALLGVGGAAWVAWWDAGEVLWTIIGVGYGYYP